MSNESCWVRQPSETRYGDSYKLVFPSGSFVFSKMWSRPEGSYHLLCSDVSGNTQAAAVLNIGEVFLARVQGRYDFFEAHEKVLFTAEGLPPESRRGLAILLERIKEGDVSEAHGLF